MTPVRSPPRTYDPPTESLPRAGTLQAARRVEREDLVTFVNAAYSCTGQREFYGDAAGQAVSIDFLHEYIRGNYRRLYARCLAVGINHFNTAKVVLELLASPHEATPSQREEEARLCAAALRRLPAPQAYRLLRSLPRRRINNRRTRALARQWLQARPDLAFDAVKYRSALRAVVRHCHLRLPPELGRFLFGKPGGPAYAHPLLDAWRRAHYEHEAIYELPYTVAEGFAAKHGIDRATFLERIEPQLTRRERLRLQATGQREGVELAADLDALSLTWLCSWVVTRPSSQRRAQAKRMHGALVQAARRVVQGQRWRLGSVAAVLDASYSASGSNEKRRRPLAVALAGHYLLREAAQHYRAHWTTPPPPAGEGVPDAALLIEPRGCTDLATPVLSALRDEPSLVVVLSDGYDNDPPGGAGEVLRVFRERLDPRTRTLVVHANPVFDADDFAPRALTPRVPTIGLRNAEDLPAMLAFARFAADDAALSGLEAFLEARVEAFVSEGEDAP